MNDHKKQIDGSEVDKDQHFLMKGLRRWGFTVAAVLGLACVAFIIVGWIHSYSHPASAGRTTATTVFVTSNTDNGCSMTPETKTYGSNITPINSTFCQLRGYVIEGCGYWYDARGRKLAYSCKGPMPSIDGIVAFGAQGSAVVRINHCNPWTPGNQIDTCS